MKFIISYEIHNSQPTSGSASKMPRHPPVDLYTNLLYLPTVQCPGRHPASPKRVKAAFPPAFCHHHGNNRDPEAGWGYLTREEARLLTIARAHDWTRDCLYELVARDLEVQMDAVHVEDAIDTLATSEDEETKE
jgi:hypothetical protein